MREIPEHLKPDAPPVTGMSVPVVDLPTALAATLNGDPLARRPSVLNDALLATIPDAEPLRAFGALTRAAPSDPAAWSAFERERRGTVAVGLARGWRLGAVESMIGPLTQGDEAAARAALLWLSGLRDAPTLTVPYSPWFFLGDPVSPLRQGAGRPPRPRDVSARPHRRRSPARRRPRRRRGPRRPGRRRRGRGRRALGGGPRPLAGDDPRGAGPRRHLGRRRSFLAAPQALGPT
ncbi:MAG: hypothetical protein IPO67_22040 [Deltaproteobacteria bacterium]|nr:hypothetical protein [Deltaproteobacteria bacterium]